MIEVLKSWFEKHFSDPQAVLLVTILLLGAVLVLYWGAILTPVLAGVIIAYVLEGLVGKFHRLGVPRYAAFIITYTLFLTALALFLFGLVPLVISQVTQLAAHVALPGSLSGAVSAALNVLPWFVLPPQPFWHDTIFPDLAGEPPIAPHGTELDLEDLFYSQARLLDRETGDLLPGRPGHIDLYFVAFAAYSGEDVFLNEARLARNLFDDRFDTRGRSVLLANNTETATHTPLANLHNLERALDQIAARMDVEEDVLFLFLNSHGSETDGLTARIGEYEMNNVTPAALQAVLARSAILWRVVVVSACHSGVFIEALRDPHAAIMTAARSDRSSFGCGHDGEFTYFGEEFFGRQLQTADSFVSAFERARAEIEARESAEERVPSIPQIEVGEYIAPVLEAFAAQLQDIRLAPDGVGRAGGEDAAARELDWARPSRTAAQSLQ